ncbi:TonB-dependent receptor plug domain-containing protein [Paucibacter soli]|uniref:TonB-dependent receptor plug domain-containing protein n=1 Tax=Paucibacter soli TaxID=3133433 RepID=UPI00309E1C6F
MSFSFSAHAASLPASTYARTLLALAAAAVAWPQSALAQNGPAANKLDQVQVTATRSSIRLDQTLADVTVLTRADIERQAFGGLADLLAKQSCFEFARPGGPGATTSLFLRGANTQHTVVMIDGVRMDTQSGSGGATWESMPLALIERVEILRGAASSLYGSDAVAGVVQIFTRKGGAKPFVEFGGGIGSLGMVKGDLSVGGMLGQLDYAFSLAAEFADGFNARPVAFDPKDPGYTPDRDDWRNHNLNARVGYQLAKGQRVELLSSSSHAESGYDASAKPKPGVNDRNIHDLRASRAFWSAQWSEAWNSELSVGESRDRYETKTQYAYLTETLVRNYALHNSLKLGPGQLNVLLERREDKLINASLQSSSGQAERHQNAAALGYLLSQAAWDAQVHLRHDQDSEFGGINTGTLAAGWRPVPALRLWASAANAFRAPTLYQSFSAYGPRAGLPALNPEKGRNAEFGLSYAQGAHELGLTIYNNRIKQLISWDNQFASLCAATVNPAKPDPWDGCYGNLAKVRLRGVSLSGSTELAGLKLSGSLDFQDPKDVLSGKTLGRRAKQHASLRVEKQWGDWTLGGQSQLSGKRWDTNANTTRLAGYALLNLDAQYRVNANLRLQLNLDNAFDRAYQTANGYAQAPRTLFMGLRYTPAL